MRRAPQSPARPLQISSFVFSLHFTSAGQSTTATARLPAPYGDICTIFWRVITASRAMVCHISKLWLRPVLFHAHCYLERQLDPTAARASAELAEGLPARHRLPAGDQVPRRGISARADRGTRV